MDGNGNYAQERTAATSVIAHLAADAAHFTFRSADGASSVETPFHRLVVVVEDAGGKVLRSIEHFADGGLDVRGEGEPAHAVGLQDDAAAETEQPASDAGEPAGEVK